MDDELAADCSRCAGLCCVALPFTRSADFAFSKPAGTPCRHLGSDHRCGIHATLAARGMAGCTAFDCFGAGQRVTQVTFGGRSWRDDAQLAQPMFAAFAIMRQLHELLVHLEQALALAVGEAAELERLRREVQRQTERPDVVDADPATLRAEVGPLLARVSLAARAGLPCRDLRGADLVGARLHAADLRGADLRGALLLGADLAGADLGRADLLGADLRGADLRGADLGDALFVTGPQLAAARGDASTRIPIPAPASWAS